VKGVASTVNVRPGELHETAQQRGKARKRGAPSHRRSTTDHDTAASGRTRNDTAPRSLLWSPTPLAPWRLLRRASSRGRGAACVGEEAGEGGGVDLCQRQPPRRIIGDDCLLLHPRDLKKGGGWDRMRNRGDRTNTSLVACRASGIFHFHPWDGDSFSQMWIF
jgi:hypothetical protein